MMLKDRVMVIYGAGGAIGGAVARAAAREGARLFVTGRSRESVDAVAADISGEAETATVEAATVDALDEKAIEAHLRYVVERAGRVDVSFNALGDPGVDILGVPLVDVDAERFAAPISAYTMSYFLTARLAARYMIPNRSGVIMTVTTLHSRFGLPLTGGFGPSQAAKEALTRSLSVELAPHGIRVVGLRPQALPDSRTIRQAYEPHAKNGMTWEQWESRLAGRTHSKRLMTPAEVADVAVFLASDDASGMTGTTVNLTMGDD